MSKPNRFVKILKAIDIVKVTLKFTSVYRQLKNLKISDIELEKKKKVETSIFGWYSLVHIVDIDNVCFLTKLSCTSCHDDTRHALPRTRTILVFVSWRVKPTFIYNYETKNPLFPR